MARLIAAGLAPLPIRSAERGWRLRLRQSVVAAALVTGLVYLTWRIGWTGAGASPWTFWPLLAAEASGWLNLALFAFTAWRLPGTARPPHFGNPSVDVFVIAHGEPIGVVHATLVGCRAIRYPKRTWLLDDGTRPEMRELARSMGAGYLARPVGEAAGVGAIASALTVTSGELVLVLDADQVPFPDILDVTVGYFDDERVAVVQTPLDYSNRDSAQHTRPDRHHQSLFFEVIAPGKDRRGSALWCGSAAVWRRRALRSEGVPQADPTSDTLRTTVALHATGWETRYHHETLVQGLAPQDLRGFLAQRERSARSDLRVLRTRQNPIVCRGLTLRQRVSHLASLLTYLSSLQRLVLLGILALTLVTGRLPLRTSPLALIAFWLPWTLLASAALQALSRGWTGVFEATRFGLITMGAYLRACSVLVSGRIPRRGSAPAVEVDTGGVAVLRSLAMLVLVGAVLLVALAARLLTVSGLLALPPLHGFALGATVALALAALGVIGWTLGSVVRRRQLRHAYRYPVRLPGRVGTGLVQVIDLSVRGAGLLGPVDSEKGATVELQVSVPDTRGVLHELLLPATVRSVRARGDQVLGAGIEFGPMSRWTRDLLVEYLAVVRGGEVVGHRVPDAGDAVISLASPSSMQVLVELLAEFDDSGPQELGDPEGEVERLAGVEPGVAHGLVAGAQVGVEDLLGAAEALGDVVAGELDVHPAGPGADGLVCPEEPGDLGHHGVEMACLATTGGGERVPVHRITSPGDRVAGLLDGS
jgi:cellulose synthase (UDP-forming)